MIDWGIYATRYTFDFIRDRGTVETMPIHIEACDQRDGSRMWAVRQCGNCLDVDGEWEHECIPSSRTDSWIFAHRFSTKDNAYQAMRKCIGGNVLKGDPQ